MRVISLRASSKGQAFEAIAASTNSALVVLPAMVGSASGCPRSMCGATVDCKALGVNSAEWDMARPHFIFSMLRSARPNRKIITAE